MSYKDCDPSKMPWTLGDEEFEDLDAAYTNYDGEEKAYYGSSEPALFQRSFTVPQREVDVNIIALRKEVKDYETDEDIFLEPEIDQPLAGTFNFKVHTAKNQDTRNKIMFGSVATRIQTLQMWGFLAWVEFNNQLSKVDKALAKELRDNLVAEAMLQSINIGDTTFTYWLAKKDKRIVKPGFWAIAIDSKLHNQRVIYANWKGKGHLGRPLSLIKENTITFRFEE